VTDAITVWHERERHLVLVRGQRERLVLRDRPDVDRVVHVAVGGVRVERTNQVRNSPLQHPAHRPTAPVGIRWLCRLIQDWVAVD